MSPDSCRIALLALPVLCCAAPAVLLAADGGPSAPAANRPSTPQQPVV